MVLLDGKLISGQIKCEIAKEVKEEMLDKGIRAPHLAAVLVGDDPGSQTYVASKERACREVGFISSVYRYPEKIKENQLLEVVDFLNNDPEIDGFIVQLPLPKHLDEQKIIEHILPSKDVDGFHPVNLGRMVLNLPCYVSATPLGIMTLLERYNVETEGKHCVVLGRSHIVGTPVSILMSRKNYPGNCTVTLCHSYTKDIADLTRQADILIVAMGRMEAVTEDMVKKDAVVIDVGMHRIPADDTKSGYRLKGDVAFAEVSKKCSFITPVPGGVGLMTVVSLLQNTLKAAKKEIRY
ncbi:MAG TPA: tetrahydrofolate dehydrogenase/cyclohydrolase catalytic domain-containing protein [Bacteroidales bacterium]|mgnify:CR=1 FL=1|nr:tetrahydrofolate dehydrogenase/cyclohydrolase catalytic domain-containing protein [Bacteroidales bacterium]HPS73757.1 tetrahydrofolate dehydrogenase/cyclohydrolase catalytic domain-containing protein [Bacteroidales bacterium]